ncbi:MAG: hypothetical protein V4474_01575 [Patescibacteria group bacterium]
MAAIKQEFHVMPQPKSLRLQVADILGLQNDSKEARVIYMLVDKIEVLEKKCGELEGELGNLDSRTSGLKTYGGPKSPRSR